MEMGAVDERDRDRMSVGRRKRKQLTMDHGVKYGGFAQRGVGQI